MTTNRRMKLEARKLASEQGIMYSQALRLLATKGRNYMSNDTITLSANFGFIDVKELVEENLKNAQLNEDELNEAVHNEDHQIKAIMKFFNDELVPGVSCTAKSIDHNSEANGWPEVKADFTGPDEDTIVEQFTRIYNNLRSDSLISDAEMTYLCTAYFE